MNVRDEVPISAYFHVGMDNFRKKKYQEAIENLTIYLTRPDGRANEALTVRGEVYMALGKADEAEKDLKEVDKKERKTLLEVSSKMPTSTDEKDVVAKSYFAVAMDQFKNAKYARAAANLTAYLEYSQANYIEVMTTRARCYLELNNAVAAINNFTMVIDYNAGVLKGAEDRDFFDQVAGYKVALADSYSMRSKAYNRLGRKEEARRDLARAEELRKKPDVVRKEEKIEGGAAAAQPAPAVPRQPAETQFKRLMREMTKNQGRGAAAAQASPPVAKSRSRPTRPRLSLHVVDGSGGAAAAAVSGAKHKAGEAVDGGRRHKRAK